MTPKNISILVDSDNGIKYINITDKDVKKTVSLSDQGCMYLDSLGADIILDFDESGNLVGLELMGL